MADVETARLILKIAELRSSKSDKTTNIYSTNYFIIQHIFKANLAYNKSKKNGLLVKLFFT